MLRLSIGKSHANFASASTRQNFCTFGKYLHLPKWHFLEICQTHKTCRHSPSHFARTRQTRRHLPNHFARLARLADIHQAVLWGLTKLADIRQMPIWWKTAPFFSRFGEFGKFSEDSHLPKWPFTEIFVTCRHLPCHFARTPQTRRHLPNALFKKMWLALLNSRESCKFGASSHSLVLTQVINRHSYDFFLFNHRKMFDLF